MKKIIKSIITWLGCFTLCYGQDTDRPALIGDEYLLQQLTTIDGGVIYRCYTVDGLIEINVSKDKQVYGQFTIYDFENIDSLVIATSNEDIKSSNEVFMSNQTKIIKKLSNKEVYSNLQDGKLSFFLMTKEEYESLFDQANMYTLALSFVRHDIPTILDIGIIPFEN